MSRWIANAKQVFRFTWMPLLFVAILGVVAPVSYAALRVKTSAGDTAETLAERYYGDTNKASIIRAANGLLDGQQPELNKNLQIPSARVHQVQAGETLAKIAGRFLQGEGAEELLAEANALPRNVALSAGQTVTVFDEIEVTTDNKTAEDLASSYLGDANLGARIRRYNGLADAAKLPSKVYVPLLGVETIASNQAPVPVSVAVATPIATQPNKTENPAPIVAQAAPAAPTAPKLDLSVPVTGKKATVVGFSHALHTRMAIAGVNIGCLACHARTDPKGFEHRAPTKADCMICHKVSDEMPTTLRSGSSVRLPLNMNHKIHLSKEGKEQNGLNLLTECKTCHTPDENTLTGISSLGHNSCQRCHAAGQAQPLVRDDPNGMQCTGCHGTVEQVDPRVGTTRYLKAHLVRADGRDGDTFFDHSTHAGFGPGGKLAAGVDPINCQVCHEGVINAATKSDIKYAKMANCVQCHNQARSIGLQPPQSCSGCHLNQRQGFMPDTQYVLRKPIDHTPMFRRSHAEAAKTQPEMCASCHAGVDPTDGNRCDTCHTVMKPRDHTAGFRDRVHGRSAQMNAERCETCHRAERCESCHRVTPKSHFPLPNFVDQGLHASRARLDLGACLTCHRFETTCTRCHAGNLNQ